MVGVSDEIEKQQFMESFAELRPDIFYASDDAVETPEDQFGPGKVRTSMYAQIPMNCTGPKCVYASVCPLVKSDNAPIGSKCPIEAGIVVEFTNGYIQQFGVSEDDMVELSMIRDLVDLEVQYMRSVKILAQEHFIVENPVGVDHEGNVVVSKDLHKAIDYEDKIMKRKHKILDAFNATREAKRKVGLAERDPSQMISDLVDGVREFRAQRDSMVLEAMGREYTSEEGDGTLDEVSMHDPYIVDSMKE